MSLRDDLRRSNAMGVYPPQNWTTRAIDEIDYLESRVEAEHELFKAAMADKLRFESALVAIRKIAVLGSEIFTIAAAATVPETTERAKAGVE